jgi:hypothetical protein
VTETMTGELLADFEACTLTEFHHADHVHVAWAILREMPLLDALARFSASLRRFAAAQGKPRLYHETITWAFMILIHERMQRAPAAAWEEFARANPDLLTWKPSPLDRYYRPETLASELARRVFLMPDRV